MNFPQLKPKFFSCTGLATVLCLVLTISFMAPSIAFSQDMGADLLKSLSGVLSDAPDGSDERASLSGNIIQLIALMTVLSIAPGLLVV